MRAPAFWWRDGAIAAGLLAPFAALYGAVAARRLARPGRTAGIPVLCVGNLTQGGAGKTPTALAVARMLTAAGARPFFLTRGYGGRLAGPVQVDPAHHTAHEVGDEPLLLARVAPTIVAHDRVAGAEAARAAGASVIVMDDGFQNPALEKDLSLLVVDGRTGIGNTRVFPAGPLRAPLDAQLARAQALVVIGDGTGAAALMANARTRGLPVFHARLEPDRAVIAGIADGEVLAFAGIGDPDKFFATLAASGIEASIKLRFPDHHHYTAAEAQALLKEADRQGLALVTTEKDLVRLAGDSALAALAERAQALPVRLAADEEERFRGFVLGVLSKEK
jgi:tetraacyldisaccharide 4'-kinase